MRKEKNRILESRKRHYKRALYTLYSATSNAAGCNVDAVARKMLNQRTPLLARETILGCSRYVQESEQKNNTAGRGGATPLQMLRIPGLEIYPYPFTLVYNL